MNFITAFLNNNLKENALIVRKQTTTNFLSLCAGAFVTGMEIFMEDVKMPLPEEVIYIMKKLREVGARADVVGGAVRDFLRGEKAGDYDITTSATPDIMRKVFFNERILETGVKHGTISVLVSGKPYEVTTYRIDGSYNDSRHPDKVEFTTDLKEDLARRDFTVNAMAYNPKDGLTDIFGGREDLSARIIRAVGDAEIRFSEDALRILRALRFASVLDFEIEEKTSEAIYKTADKLSQISRERIYTEWIKLLSGVGAYRVLDKYKNTIKFFIPELENVKLPSKERFEKASAFVRFVSLFSDKGEAEFQRAMRSLRSDTKSRDSGACILQMLGDELDTKIKVKTVLSKIGTENTLLLAELRYLLSLTEKSETKLVSDVISSGECYTLKDLKISGTDLILLGVRGKSIGETLSELLRLVINEQIKNEREEIRAYFLENLSDI